MKYDEQISQAEAKIAERCAYNNMGLDANCISFQWGTGYLVMKQSSYNALTKTEKKMLMNGIALSQGISKPKKKGKKV